jgi:hypothetical protein
MRDTAHQVCLVVSFAVALLIAGCSYNAQRITAEFTTMPANDTALQEWLKSQPTVSAPSIRVVRTASKVTLVFEASLDSPQRLDPEQLRTQFTRLGYSGTVLIGRCNLSK